MIEILVVDDASTDGSAEWVRKHHPEVRLIRLDRNGGFCQAANAGIAAARGAFIQLLNNDAEVREGWAEAGLVPFEDPKVGSVAPLTLIRSNPNLVDSAGDGYTFYGRPYKRGHRRPAERWSRRSPEPVFGASASSAFYRASALQHVGGFDPNYGSYYEDVDLAFRLRLAGLTCVYTPHCQVLHDVSASYDHGRPELHRRMSRNAERLFWSNLAGPRLLAALAPRLVFLAFQFGWKLRQGRALAFLKGKRDALADAATIRARRKAVQQLKLCCGNNNKSDDARFSSGPIAQPRRAVANPPAVPLDARADWAYDLREDLPMNAPSVPPNELSRLETLRSIGVLDTPPEERFDCLTRMARRIFNVPIALVSLVDEDRQWFKSCDGLAARETPRAISFCGHAILGDDVFVIPDTTQDDRFADNPLVVGPTHIRFYAGCPLRSLDDHMLGTLCIIDHQPRRLDEQDLQTLRDLASMAERELAAFQLATLDDLTGIANRRGFLMQAHSTLNLCARQNIPAVLAFIDLDNFKPINDRFGHAEGDRALARFVQHMKRLYRDSDLLARVGGDEFVVLFTNANRDVAEDLVARLADALEREERTRQNGYRLSFSHGIVEFDPARHHDLDALLAEGDALMYDIKRKRKTIRRDATPEDEQCPSCPPTKMVDAARERAKR